MSKAVNLSSPLSFHIWSKAVIMPDYTIQHFTIICLDYNIGSPRTYSLWTHDIVNVHIQIIFLDPDKSGFSLILLVNTFSYTLVFPNFTYILTFLLCFDCNQLFMSDISSPFFCPPYMHFVTLDLYICLLLCCSILSVQFCTGPISWCWPHGLDHHLVLPMPRHWW